LPGLVTRRTISCPLARRWWARRPGTLTSVRAFEEAMREKDVPAEQPQAEAQARLPAPDADARGPRHRGAPSVQGPLPAVGLIRPVRDRASFRAFAAGRRARRGPLGVVVIAGSRPGPPAVAYAVGKSVGNAVVRNRLRRRLRAAVRDERAALRPDRAYLITAAPRAVDLTYGEIRAALRALLTTAEAT
jgi:ribonuclease P protein component